MQTETVECPRIEWTGDLNDDCTARWEGLIGRAECMGDVRTTGIDPATGKCDRGDSWIGQTWWFAVYDEETGDEVSSGDFEGAPNTGEFARWCCEQVMRRVVAERREHAKA